MPNKCCAVGCKSGYISSIFNEKVTFHSFPLQNKELLRIWLRRISRTDFVPTKYSRLCSLHFNESDFITSSVDTNVSRKNKKEDGLNKPRLKSTAVPSVFPNLPKYFTNEGTSSTTRDNRPSFSRRQDLKQERAETMEHDLFESEKVLTLNELWTMLEKETKPSGWTAFNRENRILLLRLDLSVDAIQPRLLSSVTIKEDLVVEAFHREKAVNRESYKHIVKGESIGFVSEVTNLLAYLSSLDDVVEDHMQEAINCLEVGNLYLNVLLYVYVWTLLFAPMQYLSNFRSICRILMTKKKLLEFSSLLNN